MREFSLPDIGEGLAEAELLDWLVEVGEQVREGQPLAEISTDKVNVEIPAPCDGIIVELPWEVNDSIPVGATLAVLDTGEDVPESSSAPAEVLVETHARHADDPAVRIPAPSYAAAPSTRRLARDLSVDLEAVHGSGPGGRILRGDVEDHAAPPLPASAAAPSSQTWQDVPLTGVRATSARRMEQSARTYATATTTFTVNADGLLRLREVFATDVTSEQVGTLAMIIRAVGATLVRNPRFNARVDEERQSLLIGSEVDVAVAVATEHGLTVPVVRSVQTTTLSRIHARIKEVSELARSERLTRADLEGATFTVSSTGSMERATMTSTTPLINPPQVATLWLSRINVAPRVVDGRLEAGPVMTGSISFDHRFIDGAEATAFINDLTGFLEQPERSLV